MLFAKCGLPAGDAFNDVFVKAYALTAFDGFVARHPSVQLCSFVDDDTLTCSGREEDVLDNLAAAGADFFEVLSGELKVELSEDKLATSGSHHMLVKKLHMRLAPCYQGVASMSASNLGMDFAPGVARAKGQAVRKSRFQKLARRHRKLNGIRRTMTTQRAKVGIIYHMGCGRLLPTVLVCTVVRRQS